MDGSVCSVCGAPLYGRRNRYGGQAIGFYELTYSYVALGHSGHAEAVFPDMMHYYFCSARCLTGFARERIEPDAESEANVPN